MLDWHSEYMVIQARQRDIAAAAEFRRLLGEAGARGEKPAARRGSARRGLRYRLGAALVQWGRRLQGTARLPGALIP